MEKGIEIEEIKKIELKLEKLKITKSVVNTIKTLIISEKYLYLISHYITLKQILF